MRLVANRFNYRELYRAVYFDLRKIIVLIPVDRCNGLLYRLSLDNTQSHRTLTINNASFQYQRINTFPLINGTFYCVDKIKLIPAITYRGYTSGKISRPPFGLFKMRVHIPQTREDHLACRIDHFSA